MNRLFISLVTVVVLAGMVGCGSNSKTPPSNGMTITPLTSTVATGGTVQFTANTTGSTVTTVNWQVNGVVGGDLTNGTISGTGYYIAPANVPSKNPVTIAAVSATDSTVSASATVTITQGSAITITVLPGTASVGTSQTAQFTATLANTANTAVNWKVNDVYGGDPTHGIIDITGLYIAPASVPSPNTVTITAESQADTSKKATATVTITPFTFVTVSPSAVTLQAGATQDFTASVPGHTTTYTWSVSCHGQAPTDCGSLVTKDASTATYTAPLSPPPGGNVTITAKTTDNSANPGGAVATIQFADGSLNGQYAFTFSGQNAGTPYAVAGSISVGGQGQITGGVADINQNGASSSISVTGGSYQIGTDGHGNAIVNLADGSTVTWRIALLNHSHGVAIMFDTTGPRAAGTLDLQTSADFTAASITGSYGLRLGGGSGTAAATSLVAAGALSADGGATITQGRMDVNTPAGVQTDLALTGTYTSPSTAGRGTLTVTSAFGDQQFVYYIVDASHLKLVETDATHVASGDLVKQTAGPLTAGSFAVVLGGSSSRGALGVGGVFSLDGAAAITGTMDVNDNGTVQNASSFSGNYVVTDAATGRATATFTVNSVTANYVLYPQADGVWNVIGVDASNLVAGQAFAQDGSLFNHSSLQGDYVLQLAGIDRVSDPGPESIVGELVPNGGSALAGTFDIDDSGTLVSSTAVQGSYTVAPSGRATATMQGEAGVFSTPSNFSLYIVDSNRVLLMESDSNRVLVGVMQKQQ